MTPHNMTPHNMTPHEMIARLVGFDTTSRNSNLELIDFVEGWLAEYGVSGERIASADGTKANFLARVGPDAPGGIVLSGHTDVVPVDGQAWSSDPFRLSERDGLLYGRGSCDMKSFLAVALALVPEMTKLKLKAPIWLAMSYDEEVGCIGVGSMIERMGLKAIKPSLVVVGEPTSMKVADAHKGICAFATEVTGHESHSSATDKGVSAVMKAAGLIDYLSGIAEERRKTGGGGAAARFDPPHTTVNVGIVGGGTAVNIMAGKCSFEWEYRTLPQESADGVLDQFEAHVSDVSAGMRKISASTGVETRVLARAPAFDGTGDEDARRLILRLSEQNGTHAVSYATEAGLFQEAGMAAMVCGPGDIAQAHKPDEFVSLEQVALCERFMRRVMDHLS